MDLLPAASHLPASSSGLAPLGEAGFWERKQKHAQPVEVQSGTNICHMLLIKASHRTSSHLRGGGKETLAEGGAELHCPVALTK